MISTASLQGSLGNSKEDREDTITVEFWKTGTFQMLASLAKAFSRKKKASSELSICPGHFMAAV